ncbi:hypothetical protein Mapa_000956 [Marchantia paleacea]|nr:hypothetical protein Mapa_000956 [Marchantia paleacea]
MTEPKENERNNEAVAAAVTVVEIRNENVSLEDQGSSEAENARRVWNVGALFSPASTTIAAGLYLLDFISNITVLKEYWDYYKTQKWHGYIDTNDGTFSSKPFAMCLGLMVAGHIGTVIAFKLKLPRERNPLLSAYFLPLVQFRRFVQGVIKTGSCARHSAPSEPLDFETEALYSMVAAAIETGPQAALQFLVIVVVSRRVKSRKVPLILLLSLVASFLSASYNTGRAVMFKLSRRWTVTLNNVGLLAGIYTAGALLLRMCSIAAVMNYWMKYFQPGFLAYFPLWLFPGSYIIGMICVAPARKLLSLSGQLHAVVAGYVNFTLGPLYPVVDGYRSVVDQGSCKSGMGGHLGLTVGLNLLLDIIPICVSAIIQQSPCVYHLDSGEQIISTFTCRRYLAYIITGTTLTVVVTIALICLLNSVEKRESASVSDETCIENSESRGPELVAEEENPEYPFYQLSQRIELDKTEAPAHPQQSSTLVV